MNEPESKTNNLDLFHYQKYNEVLKANNAMDFSDLLLNARKLLDDAFVLEKIQERNKREILRLIGSRERRRENNFQSPPPLPVK